MSSIVHGAALNFTFKVVGLCLGLVLTVITARLGLEERGLFALFTLIASVFMISFSGFGASIAYHVSRLGVEVSRILPSALLFAVGVGTVASAVFFSWGVYSDSELSSYFWMLSLCSPFLLIIPFINGVHLSKEKMLPLNINSTLPQVITLISCGVIWLFSEFKIEYILLSWVFAQILSSFIAISGIRKYLASWHVSFHVLKEHFSFVAKTGVTNLIGLLNYKVDLFLVQYFLGLAATGIYSIAIVIAELLWFVSSSVTIAAYGRIGSSNKDESERLVVRIVQLNLIILTVIFPLLYAIAYIAIPIVFGSPYEAALTPLLVMLPGVLVYGAASSLSAYFTNQLGMPGLSAKVAFVSLSINLVLSVVLIPSFGLIGAAFATSVSYLIGISVMGYLFVTYSNVSAMELLCPRREQIRSDLGRVLGSFSSFFVKVKS